MAEPNRILDLTTILPHRETVLLSVGEFQICETDDLPLGQREEISRLQSTATYLEGRIATHAQRREALAEELALAERSDQAALRQRYDTEVEPLRAKLAAAEAKVEALDAEITVNAKTRTTPPAKMKAYVAARKEAKGLRQQLDAMPSERPRDAEEIQAELYRMFDTPALSDAELAMYDRVRLRLASLVIRDAEGLPVSSEQIAGINPVDVDMVLVTFLALRQLDSVRTRKQAKIGQWLTPKISENQSTSNTSSPSSNTPIPLPTPKAG